MCFGRKPLHAVLPGPIPVALLQTLVHQNWGGQDEGAWAGQDVPAYYARKLQTIISYSLAEMETAFLLFFLKSKGQDAPIQMQTLTIMATLGVRWRSDFSG